MVSRPEEFRKQMNQVWQQAADQLEVVKKALMRSADRFEADLRRLRGERDKVLKRLGLETRRLANQAKVPMPSWVKDGVDRLNVAIDSVVKKSGPRSRGSKKPRARKAKATKRAARS